MKLSTRLALVRPLETVFFLCSFGALSSFFGYFMVLRHHAPDRQLFGGLVWLAAWYGGGVVSLSFHSILHRPATMTLPSWRRLFWRQQLPWIGLLAAALAAPFWWLHDTVSPLVATAIAFMWMTLSLPIEPFQQWRGHRKTAVLLHVAVMAGVAAVDPVVRFCKDHPLPVTALACGMGFAAIHAATDPRQLRRRTQRTVLFGRDALNPRLAQQAAADHQRQTGRRGRVALSLTRTPIADDESRLMQAAMVARFGSIAGVRRLALLLPLASALPLALVAAFDSVGPNLTFVHALHQTVWGGPSGSGGVAVIAALGPLGALVSFGLQFQPLIALPLSRTRKLRLATRLFQRTLGLVWGNLLLFAIAASAGTAVLAGQPLWAEELPLLVRGMLAVPAVTTLAIWGMMLGRHGAMSSSLRRTLNRIMITVAVIAAGLTVLTVSLSSGALIAVLIALTLLGSALYQRCQRRLYLELDLAGRSV